MRSNRVHPRAFAGAFFFLLALPSAGTPQVVGDEACERYAVDIAAFATCVDGKVVKPDADAILASGRPALARSPATRPSDAKSALRAAGPTAPPVTRPDPAPRTGPQSM